MHSVEETIFKNLITNKEYSDRVMPYLSDTYFSSNSEKILYKIMSSHYLKYNVVPSIDDILTIISTKKIAEKIYNDFLEKIEHIRKIEPSDNTQWLIDKTEDFCKDRALYNAVSTAVSIYDNKSDKDRGSLQNIFRDALGVSFNKTLGHDYINDAEKRFEYYHNVENKFELNIDILNKITRGGFSKKTLNIFVAAPGVGKTMIMCSLASDYIKKGLSILYITLEMAEEKISERLDVNNLDVTFDELPKLNKDEFLDKIAKIKQYGSKFKVKEFPTSSIHVGHIRTLLRELELKEKFVPDILFVDYINIMNPMNTHYNNSYEKIKNICEELRGLAVEMNLPVISATQTNREGVKNQDMDYTNIAESMGVATTADFIIGMSANDELKQSKQILFKQLKNRYQSIDYYNKFLVGADYSKMRLYNLEGNVDVDSEHKNEYKDNSNESDIFSEFKC